MIVWKAHGLTPVFLIDVYYGIIGGVAIFGGCPYVKEKKSE